MVDNHYWYTWPGKTPTNCNAIGEFITINADLGNSIPSASWVLMIFVAWFTPKNPTSGSARSVEIALISQQDGQNYFEAIKDGTNMYRFTTPIVVGHKYMPEIKIKTGPLCHYVLQDITAGTVETHDEPLSSPAIITLAETGIEWHNLAAAALFNPRYTCSVTAFGGSINGGSSYQDFTAPDSLTPANDGSGLAYTNFFGGFSLNGVSEGQTSTGGTGVFYNVPDDTSNPVKLFAGGTTRFGELHHISPGSSLSGKTIKTVLVYLRKVGSPTGTVFGRIRYDDDTLVQGCEASTDASTLSTSSSPYTFTFTSPVFNFPDDGVSIMVEYSGGNSTNYVAVDEAQTDKFEAANSCSAYFTTARPYTFGTTKDLCGIMSTSTSTGPATGGTGGTTTGGGGGGGNVAGGDLRFFYSGGIGNSEGSFSLGGGISEHEIPTYMLDALFDDIPGGEAKAGASEYRCIYVKNINFQSALSYITFWSPTGGSVSPDSFFYFGMGQAPVNGIEPSIPNSNVAPAHVVMAEYNNLKSPLAIPDLPAGAFRPMWIWRKVKANTRTFSRDQAIIEADYYAPPPAAAGGGDGGTGGTGGTPQCPTGYTYDPAIAMCVRSTGGTGTSAAKTGHGVSLLYATLGGDRYFELMNKNQPNIGQVDFQSTLSEFAGTKPNVSFKVSSQDQVRVECGTVDTPGGFNDKSAIPNLNTAYLASKGYMATNKDWRNYEAQWYLLVHSYSSSTSSGEAHTELEGRCGYNSTDSTAIGSPSLGRWCESTKYNYNGYFTGRVKFEKCLQHTNGYSSSNPEKTGALNPSNWKGVWTGFKQVIYNMPGTTSVNGQGPKVKIEGYVDQGSNATSPSNNWVKVIEAIDDGSGKVFSGPRGSYVCGSDHLIPVSWGGPLLIFRWDHLDAEFRWLSVYELDPTIKPAGTGGGVDVVPPLTGGGQQPPAAPPVGSARLYYICFAFSTSPEYDKTMIHISAQLVDTMVSPEPDNSNQYVIIGNAAYEIAGYCAGSLPSGWVQGRYGSSPTDEDLSAYWDDSAGKCVSPGAQSTTSSKSGSKGIVQNFFGPQLDKGPKVFVIFWGSDWNTRSLDPTKAGLETKIRDYLLSRDTTYFSKLSQYGINTVPVWGKSCVNVTTPVPSSNPIPEAQFQQCIHDSIQKGLIDSPVLSENEAVYICIAPATKTAALKDRTGVVGGSTHNYYDYDASASVPGHHDASGGSSTVSQIYNFPGLNTPRQLYTGATLRFGWVVNAGSILLVQDPITQIAFYISKSGAPTGTIYYRIRNAADAVVCEFGNLDAATDIVSTGAPELHRLRNEANQYILQVGDKILCEYGGGSSSNYIKVDEVANNADFDGTFTCSDSYTGTTYTQTTTTNPAGELWSGYVLTGIVTPGTGSGGGGGGGGPGPPDTVIYDVASTNTPNHMYTGSYVRTGEQVMTSSSVLFGQVITRVDAYLRKAGSPTGTVYCRIRKGSDDSIAADMGNLDITTLTGTMAAYTFTNINNAWVMAVNDKVLIEYSGGSSGTDLAEDDATSSFDGANSADVRYISSYTNNTSDDACFKIWTSSTTVGGGGTGGTFTPVYTQALKNAPVYLDSAENKRYGVLLNSASSVLIGSVITQIDVLLKKEGSPTGNISVLIRDNTDAIKATFPSIDSASLTTNWSTYTVQLTTNAYALLNGDRIQLEYSGGNATNRVDMDHATTGGPDSSNTCAVHYVTSYTADTADDPSMTLYTTVGGGGSGPPPPAPFTTVYDVSVASNHLSFSSGQRRQGEYIQSGCALIGKIITRVSFYLNRWSRGGGTITCAIYDPSNTLKVTIGTINVTSLPSNDNDQIAQFTNTANTYALEAGSFVSIEVSAANGDLDGCTHSGVVSNAYARWNDGSGNWGSRSSDDYCGTMETGGV